MNGSVLYDGNTLLSGAINVNTGGNIEPLNVSITENGNQTINAPLGVNGYNPITIETNVPSVEPILDDITITENGTYTPPTGTDGYDEIVVNVPPTTPVLDDITITENGTYTPPSGTDGYNDITVNVPQSTPVLDEITITENGTYTPPTGTDGYNDITVNVPLPENAYLLEEYEDVPTDIASFTASDAPLKSLTASIVPVQAGSGDPSPTNVRPLSGWDECNVNRAKVYQICVPIDSTEITANGVTMTYLGKGKYRVKGTFMTNEYTSLNLPIVPFTIYGGDDCYIKMNNSVGLSAVSIIFKNNTSQVDSWGLYPSNRSDSYVGMRNKYTNNITIAISSAGYGTNFDFTFKVEILSNSTANLSTYNISFAGTVYGGSVDVVNGVVTPCPYYASYNGEQLTGEWISDRDVYSPNTSPTIGAQVVNIGATDTPFSVQPTSIKSLDGENNVFASTGQIENLEFFTKEE